MKVWRHFANEINKKEPNGPNDCLPKVTFARLNMIQVSFFTELGESSSHSGSGNRCHVCAALLLGHNWIISSPSDFNCASSILQPSCPSFLIPFISDISTGFACVRKVLQCNFCSLQQWLKPRLGQNSRGAILQRRWSEMLHNSYVLLHMNEQQMDYFYKFE